MGNFGVRNLMREKFGSKFSSKFSSKFFEQIFEQIFIRTYAVGRFLPQEIVQNPKHSSQGISPDLLSRKFLSPSRSSQKPRVPSRVDPRSNPDSP